MENSLVSILIYMWGAGIVLNILLAFWYNKNSTKPDTVIRYTIASLAGVLFPILSTNVYANLIANQIVIPWQEKQIKKLERYYYFKVIILSFRYIFYNTVTIGEINALKKQRAEEKKKEKEDKVKTQIEEVL